VNDYQVRNVKIKRYCVGFDDCTLMVMKSSVFWDVTPDVYCCSIGDYLLVTDNECLQMH
jgi:hypothetical protein